MSILDALKSQQGSIRELAMLPQQEILKLAQSGQLNISLVPVVLNEKALMIKQAAQMQAMAQPPQPTIIEQAMATNATAEAPSAAQQAPGIEALPISRDMIRPDKYAGGGIVAFADGGFNDDEEDDDDEEDKFYSGINERNQEIVNEILTSMQAQRGAASPMGPGIMGTGITPKEQQAPMAAPREKEVSKTITTESATTAAPGREPITLSSAKEESRMGLKVPSTHKFKDEIVAEAERAGLDPNFALYIAGKETGGLRNPEAARSRAGAMGVMQLMPGTARDMGVKDPLDPSQNIAGGVRYAKMMLDKYGDPKLAAIAYNWGPGNTDKWLSAGADPSKLPNETRKYIASLKEGGEVRFQNTGFVDPMFSSGDMDASNVMQRSELVELMSLPELQEYNRSGIIPERLRRRVGERQVGDIPMGTGPSTSGKSPKFGPPPRTAAQKVEDLASQAQFEAQDIQEGRADVPATIEQIQQAAAQQEGAPATKAAEEDVFGKYLSKMEENLASRRQQDKYMALLAAGLGMMGGTSPYALANIGAGGMKGVESLLASQKLRATEESALTRGRLGQYSTAQTQALRRELAESGKESRIGQLIGSREKQLETKAFNDVVKTGLVIDSAEGQAAISKRLAELKSSDPYLAKLYKDFGLPPIQATPMAGPSVDYAKRYSLTPRKQQ